MLGELESKHPCLWQANSAISRGACGRPACYGCTVMSCWDVIHSCCFPSAAVGADANLRKTVLLVWTSPDRQLVTRWEFVWAVGKGALVWPLECIVCMLKIKWRSTELWNVCVEIWSIWEIGIYFCSWFEECWALELGSNICQVLLGGAVSQSLVFSARDWGSWG